MSDKIIDTVVPGALVLHVVSGIFIFGPILASIGPWYHSLRAYTQLHRCEFNDKELVSSCAVSLKQVASVTMVVVLATSFMQRKINVMVLQR